MLSDFLNCSNIAIASFRLFLDHSWQYDYYSAGCETVFGFSADEMMQDIWWSRIPIEDQQSAILPVKKTDWRVSQS
ncbi:MAG: hypothetical protein HC839_01205 [Leptolyngbyaceae cyanobacterium RM2_2_21]|nr:hypothetical protein [Leptolyngbyaceae cyanobacterium RM2_2_21]